MEPKEVSPALLHPPIVVVATLDELLDTLPRREEETLLESPGRLPRDLEDFTKELRDTLHRMDDTWRRHIVTSDDDDDPVTSLSRALAAYKSTPGTTWDRVTMAASEWQGSVAALVDGWARLAGKATELHNVCREAATEVATTRTRELQEEVAHVRKAEEHVMELGQSLSRAERVKMMAKHEAQVREQARAASEARRATIERQWVEVAVGPLKRLEAACHEATALPRELQRRLRDTETALEGTKKKFPDVPEELVAKVAEAERLWEANTRLARDHLLGAVDDIILRFYSERGGRARSSARGVAERCLRAIEDIPRLLQSLQRPQGVPKVSTASMELQEVSPALLHPQVTMVAILGELVATLPTAQDEALLESPGRLPRDLQDFTEKLQATLHCIDDTWRGHTVTSDDDDPVTSLSRALAAYKSTPQKSWDHVTWVASKWRQSVAALVDSWAQLAGAATKLHDTCRDLATKAADIVATARARELQEEAAHYGTAEEPMVELGQALGGEEGAEVVAGQEAQVREQARAASEATRATMVRQRLEVALGLLERLVATCDEATAFPRELQRLLGDTETALEGTKKKFPDVPEELVAKVAEAERLWEANTRLARDHLLGIIDDIILEFYSERGGRARPSAYGVAERCLRATEDIPRLLRSLQRPQGVPKVSAVSKEPKELSPALLQPQVTMVAILGELLDTRPSWEEETSLFTSPWRLYRDLEEFTKELRDTLHRMDDTWKSQDVTSDYEDILVSMSQAVAAYKRTPQTTQDDVTMVASKWKASVAVLVDRWTKLARKASELLNACSVAAWTKAATATTLARELQAMAALYGTAEEHSMELGQTLSEEKRAKVVARREAQVRRDAKVAASEATRAIMERQRAEVALGPLQRLEVACLEATAFPRALRHLVRDIEVALKETSEASPKVPQDLVAKVAEAERLWVANARLAKDHLLGIIDDIINFYSKGGRARPSASEVAARCQRAIKDIPNLLQG